MDRKSLGNQVQKYRERAGYSQEKLAEIIDCSTIFISYIERGVKSPGLNKLIKISNALNIPVDILLGNELSSYNMEKLLDIEKQLKKLPLQEQQRILEIIDSIIDAICAARRPLVRLPAATRRSPTATFIKVFR